MSRLLEHLLARGNERRSTSIARHSSQRTRISTQVARRLSVIGVAEQPQNGTVAGAAINTLCNVIGAGVLSLPLAMYEASIVGGLLLMLYTALLAIFAAFAVIVGCEWTQRFSFTEVMAFLLFPPLSFEEFCTETLLVPSEELVETEKGTIEHEKLYVLYANGEAARRKKRRLVTVVVEFLIFLNNFGALIIYSRVIADSIPPVIKTFLHGSGLFITPNFWLVVSGVIFFLLTCVRNMSELKWTSLLGFITIFYIVLTVVARFFTSRHDPPYPNVDPISHGETNWYHLSTGLFRTMSTYGVAFSYHYNLPYFYREMRVRTPENMMKSVYLSFPIIITCYVATGIFGYLTFGNLVSDAAAGGDIVRNYPVDDPVVNVCRLGLFLHFACVFPILSVCARRGVHRLVIFALLWGEQTARIEKDAESMRKGRNDDSSSSFADLENMHAQDIDADIASPASTTRLAILIEAAFIVGSSVVLAAFIPGISFVINYTGLLLGIFTMFTCPGIAALVVFSRQRGPVQRPFRYARLFVVFGVILFLSGVLFTIVGMIFTIKAQIEG